MNVTRHTPTRAPEDGREQAEPRSTGSISRRQLLRFGIQLGLGAAAGGGLLSSRVLGGTAVAREPWATLEELTEGVWAVVSTPLENDDWTTGCNGGLIAGKERVLAIESYLRPAGARWLARQAEAVTGRPPTDVLITHFHADHANGLEGYDSEQTPRVWATRTTLDLIGVEDSQRDTPPSERRSALLAGASLIEDGVIMALDLGGRTVTVHPRRGHTPSDVTVEIEDPSLVFCGDLVWNSLFPNYRDTLPSEFSRSIRALRRERATTYVSGHGPLATGPDVDRLLILVDSLAEAAHQGHEKGIPVPEAAAGYRLPADVSDWLLFNPKYFEVAFKAWYRELG